MPSSRIDILAIGNVKGWMLEHRDSLILNGINRIYGYYNDDGDNGENVDSIVAYWQEGSNFVRKPYAYSHLLVELLNAMTHEDGFFQGSQGNGGEFRLILDNCSIEHSSYEYVTSRLEHDIEVF